MQVKNAILIFGRSLIIERGAPEEPFAAMSWEDVDVLTEAVLSDLVRSASQMPDTDMVLYHPRPERFDSSGVTFRHRLRLLPLAEEGALATHIHRAIEEVFREGYQRVVVLLDTNPLLNSPVLRKVFNQLGHEEDCLILGPSPSGRCYLLGMNSNHADIFDWGGPNGDLLAKPLQLLERVCREDSLLFLLKSRYLLDSSLSILRLQRDIEALQTAEIQYRPQKTLQAFRSFEKKYRLPKGVT